MNSQGFFILIGCPWNSIGIPTMSFRMILHSDWNSLEFQWNSYNFLWTPSIALYCDYLLLRISLEFQRFPLEFLSCTFRMILHSDWISLEFQWNSYNCLSTWNSLEFPWILHSDWIPLEFPWNFFSYDSSFWLDFIGIPMEFHNNSKEFQCRGILMPLPKNRCYFLLHLFCRRP